MIGSNTQHLFSVSRRSDTTHYTTSVTHYLRDAGGNVMAIYKDSLLTEQPIYGSSRVGQYKGTTVNGSLTLGERRYELNNHLGNVLAVITDNINMQADSAWANVVSTADYYPFGLEMKGRVYTDTINMYRYGFNGKEKDGNFGDLVYDYGFRIYNPRIAKFLSVDPLTKSYPMLTPYQFASNTPIQAIDLDGLEKIWYFTAQRKRFVGLDQALKILDKAGIIQELAKEFSTGNRMTDVYIKVVDLDSEFNRGSTYMLYQADIGDNNKDGILLYKEDYKNYFKNNSGQDSKSLEIEAETVKQKTLQYFKTPIIVTLNKKYVEKAAKDGTIAKAIALTITHELKKHVMDLKDRVDDRDQGVEHMEFFNDPEYYKEHDSGSSPDYEEVKKDSPAGEYKERIENAYESLLKR